MSMPGLPELLLIVLIALSLVVPFAIAVAIILLFAHRVKQPTRHPNLKPCPDCGHRVSRRATVCPRCGRPLQPEKVDVGGME